MSTLPCLFSIIWLLSTDCLLLLIWCLFPVFLWVRAWWSQLCWLTAQTNGDRWGYPGIDNDMSISFLTLNVMADLFSRSSWWNLIKKRNVIQIHLCPRAFEKYVCLWSAMGMFMALHRQMLRQKQALWWSKVHFHMCRTVTKKVSHINKKTWK